MSELYEVKLISEQQSQGMLNRFYYLTDGAYSSAIEVADWFSLTLLPTLINIHSSLFEYKGLRVTNVLNPADTVVASGDIPGPHTGDVTGTFDAWSFYLQPASATFRKGGKRFGGVPEGLIVNGEPASSGVQALLNAVAIIMTVYHAIDAESWIRPGLARKVTDTSWLFSQIVGAGFNMYSTQNSRKRTRGGGPITPFSLSYDGVTNILLDVATASGSSFGGDTLWNDGDWTVERAVASSITFDYSSPMGIGDTLSGLVEADGTFTEE